MTKGPPNDWQPPAISVFISGLGRSGSTLLCRAIECLDLIGLPLEFFNVETVERLTREPVTDLTRCFLFAREAGVSRNGIFASKLFWHQFAPVLEEFNFDAWFPNQRWVFLQRRDRLGQAISWSIAEQTKQWNSDIKAERAPVYSREGVAGMLQRLDSDTQSWLRYFDEREIDPLRVFYEDLEKGLHIPVAAIARLAGGSDLEAAVRRSEPFQSGHFPVGLEKQRTGLNEEWRHRFLGGR